MAIMSALVSRAVLDSYRVLMKLKLYEPAPAGELFVICGRALARDVGMNIFCFFSFKYLNYSPSFQHDNNECTGIAISARLAQG